MSDWEVSVPEIGRSVFAIPSDSYDSNREHVVIPNDAAWCRNAYGTAGGGGPVSTAERFAWELERN